MKTFEKIAIGLNAVAALTFMGQLIMGVDTVSTWAPLSWCIACLCYVCITCDIRNTHNKLIEKYADAISNLYKRNLEIKKLEDELAALKKEEGIARMLDRLPKWIKAEDSDGNLTSHYLVFNLTDNLIKYKNCWKNEVLVEFSEGSREEVVKHMLDWCIEHGYTSDERLAALNKENEMLTDINEKVDELVKDIIG